VPPSISIIIVTYNGWHHLEPCLLSVLPQLEPGDEIVIIDNGSSDGTEGGILSIDDSRVVYQRLETNLGFAAANNIGAQRAKGEWVLLLNNDTVVLDGFFAGLRSAAMNNCEYRIFASKMIRASDGKIDNVGIAVTAPLLRQVQLSPGSDPEMHKNLTEVFGASGGAMLVHRSVIEDIGLFDSRFFAYCEDVDFALRARIAGYRCAFVPVAAVLHKQSSTGSKMPSLRRYYIQRNMELALFRNLSSRDLLRYAPAHLAYTLFQLTRWTLRGHPLHVLKAKIDAVRLWPGIRVARGPVRVTPATLRDHLRGRFLSTSSTEVGQERPVQEQAV
jgi:GT2 family glycosyltransferase